MEQLEIIHKSGQPYGIRNKGGYLLFFPNVCKFSGQEERYITEIKEAFELAEKIIKALSSKDKKEKETIQYVLCKSYFTIDRPTVDSEFLIAECPSCGGTVIYNEGCENCKSEFIFNE